MRPPGDVTRLLLRWSGGDERALEQLMPLVYVELLRMARRHFRGERGGHTLEPTALVSELYLRLVSQRDATWENRAQFFGVAAQLMRRILVDHARAHQAQKRGGGVALVPLDDADRAGCEPAVVDILSVDAALDRLAEQDPDQVRIVEWRFFAGLTIEEIAHLLNRSERTVKREWRLARAWLFRELQERPPQERT